MVHVAWFVEHVYPFIVPVVIVTATFIFFVRQQRRLAMPFIMALLLVVGAFYITHLWPFFFLSLPSMFVTLWIPALMAACLAYPLRWALRRSGLQR